MSGTFVAVVGPSGVGKDSIINYARDRLAEHVAIVRRVVTRDGAGGNEDHEHMTPAAFAGAEKAGRFALSWEAHGLSYGLPIELEADLRAGRVVIANLSRAVLARLVARYPTALVVEITADPAAIAERLAGRGRESPEEIRRRMNRSPGTRLPASTIQIDNSGAIEVAGDKFVALVRDLLRLPV